MPIIVNCDNRAILTPFLYNYAADGFRAHFLMNHVGVQTYENDTWAKIDEYLDRQRRRGKQEDDWEMTPATWPVLDPGQRNLLVEAGVHWFYAM